MDVGPYVTSDRYERVFTSMDGGPYVIGRNYGFEKGQNIGAYKYNSNAGNRYGATSTYGVGNA